MDGFNNNPSGAADPWLPANAMQTLGNNVDAYADDNAPDGFSDGRLPRATTTSAQTFDRTYDVTLGAAGHADQPMASRSPTFLRHQLAARLVVRLGLRRGGRQRPARQLRPRRRRGRRAPRRGAGRRARAAQQRQHVRRPPTARRRACRCTCGTGARAAHAHARRRRRPSHDAARAASARRTSTSPATSSLADDGTAARAVTDALRSDHQRRRRQDRAHRPRHLQLRRSRR